MPVRRVQALANGDLKEVPTEFIRPVDEQPGNIKAVEGMKVPIISLSQPWDILVHDVSKASREWGVFLLVDHGIPHELLQKLKEGGQEVFNVPQEEKDAHANDLPTGKHEGYGTTHVVNGRDREWLDYFFHVMAPSSQANSDIWPKSLHSYREVTKEYSKELIRVTEKLLKLLSEGLGLEAKVLKSSLGDDNLQFKMKMNLYPPCPQPELALGVKPHTDIGALTLIVQNDISGLQTFKDGNWVPIECEPTSLVVQIGDQIEILSNGNYKRCFHRSLVNKDLTRMSWVVFIGPPDETLSGPLQELVNDQNPSKYSTRSFAEYRYHVFHDLPL